jgi:hypothetical protein
MDQFTDRIGVGLVANLDGFEWLSSSYQLRKRLDDGWVGISIEVLPASKRGFVKLAAHGHIRNDEIEDRYTSFNSLLTSTDVKEHATLTINCDTLLRNSPLIHGFSSDESSVEQFILGYARELRQHVVPWLEKHVTKESLLRGLSSGNPREWITSDRLTRFPVLLAIHSGSGDWEEFEKIAEEFSKYCEKPHGLVHKPYAEAVIKGLRQLCS